MVIFKLIWLDPVENQPEFVFDDTLLTCAKTTNANEIRKLITKAYKTQLHPSQQQQIEKALTKDPSLAQQAGMTPEKFADLVQLNPSIALKMILAHKQDSAVLSP